LYPAVLLSTLHFVHKVPAALLGMQLLQLAEEKKQFASKIENSMKEN